MSDEEKEMLRALNALRLEVQQEIAVDVADKVKAHSRAQGERIERLRAALTSVVDVAKFAVSTEEMGDHCGCVTSMCMAAVEALKEDDSHV